MAVNPEDRRVVENDEIVVRSDPAERQSVNVAPMIWVLGVGTVMAAVCLAVAWVVV